MTLTVVGLITILGIFIGASYKLYCMIRGIETTLSNHFNHKLERIEDKLDKIEETVYELKGNTGQ